MEKLINILLELHPDVDFEKAESLIDDMILDSFDIISLMSEISDEYDVTIHRYYETVGHSEMGDFEAIAFVVSGEGVCDLMEDLNDWIEFGFDE